MSAQGNEPPDDKDPNDPQATDPSDSRPACVMVFNACDPSGAGGLAADAVTVASVGAHALPVVTGAYMRDTAEVFDHVGFDSESVSEQARAVLEDVTVQVFKVGFVGSAETLSAVAEITSDYPDVPVITYMPDLSWWSVDQIESYMDACQDLLLPQTTVLVGNHSTLRRWLLPDWSGERNPGPRDIARAAAKVGVSYTLVTGMALPDNHVENALASPQAVVGSERFERFDAVFSGAGDTLSAALAALLATGCDLAEASSEALTYLDHALADGFRPGMGNVVPDRMFWAQPEDASGDEDEGAVPDDAITNPLSLLSGNDTQH